MYEEDLAEVYDTIYVTGVGKDYRAEAIAIAGLIRRRCPRAASLLDVACGTGLHLSHLRRHFDHVEGLEAAAAMRRRAEARLPGVPIHSGDLRGFAIGRRFDAVTCLFSAIGYVRDETELNAGLAAMAAHLNPGGVLVVEPWFTPEQWRDGSLHHTVAEDGGRTVIRVSHSTRTGRTSVLSMHYLVAEAGVGVRHFTDEHALTLFTEEAYRAAFAGAGCVDIETVSGWTEGRPRLVATIPS